LRQLRRFRRGVRHSILAAIIGIVALAMPGAVLADDIDTPAGHHAEDAVIHDAATEARLNNETRIRSARASQATAAAVGTDPGQVGSWGPVVDWPVVGIHVSLLPNGKVLAWDSVGDAATETFPVQDFTRATVYDPITGTQTPANVDTGFNIFCAGFAHLFDGALFIAGGNKNQQLQGIIQTHLFYPATNDWSLGPDMAAGRWYPSVTPLTNGEMLITEGGPDIPEVRKTDGTLRTLSTASLNLPLYPWLDVAPDGRVFYSGPDQTLRKLDPTGGGAWQTFGQRDSINRSYGSHAVFGVGKTLVAGGGASTNTAVVIDTNGATPQVSTTSPMAYGRRQFNLTLLADGSVLATGGNSTGASLIDMNGGVYNAERWDPATGQWTTLAAQSVTRQYHSTALLLPDGRVLSSGGGICGTCDQVGYLAKNAEIFTPPYLFKKDGSGQLAARPEITGVPTAVSHGTSFQITTPNAASIRKVGMMRLGSQTHSVEMEQHYLPLSFTVGNGTLTATVPANMHTAVPGVYMLFIVDSGGVPSVARIVQLDSSSPPPNAAPSAPANLRTTAATQSSVTVAWDASTDDSGVAPTYRLFKDGGQVTTTTATSFTFPNLTCGTGYTFGVEAYDAQNLASTRSLLTSATSACSPPPPPAPSADLALTKAGTLSNSTATWTLQARNIGPDLAQSVVVTDTLPSRVSYTSAPGCTYASATRIVRCELASLAAGSTATFTITTSVGKGNGWVTNTAQVTSSTADPSTTNNSATARVR